MKLPTHYAVINTGAEHMRYQVVKLQIFPNGTGTGHTIANFKELGEATRYAEERQARRESAKSKWSDEPSDQSGAYDQGD